ncbi:hypothetical protein [Thiohalorhabdus methylotrophus]|uniref:LTXXQ motif family protein n=1 Tax=Thiohalorhabdus methylotrophus TaxID=3242694 RepID=A0ABV4TXY8_9GAMM
MKNPKSVPAHRTSLRAVLIVLLTGALFVGSAAAQTGQSGGGAGGSGMNEELKKEIRQAQQRVQELRQRIGKIQQQALQNNPELQEQRQDLKGLLKEKMQAKGTTPDKDLDRMKEIRKKLSGNKDMPQGERQQLMQEFQKKAQGFQKAQKAAMKDPEVQEARKEFRDNLMTAMKEEEPKVDQLLQDLQQARKEFQQILSDRFSGQGTGMGSGQGMGSGPAKQGE